MARSPSTPEHIAERYIRAWNEQDALAVRACFTPDGCYIDSIHEREIIGDEIVAYAEASFEMSPDMHFEILNRTGARGGNVAVQWIMSGSGIEAFFGREVSGRPVSILGLDFLSLERNRIRTCISYYDLASLERGIDRDALASVNAAAPRLSVQAAKEIRSLLERLLEDPAVYTDPELTLAGLAARMNVSPTYLSHVVNSEYALSFRDFINERRIAAAQRLLQAVPAGPTVAEVGYQVGFNSASAFYAAFRKFTGKTPLAFRKEAAADAPRS